MNSSPSEADDDPSAIAPRVRAGLFRLASQWDSRGAQVRPVVF